MGSPWNERRTEVEEHGIDHLGVLPAKPGLEAEELDLLRQAPDYDAEEMASVRPTGGWPASLVQPGPSLAQPGPSLAQPAPAEKPSPPWLPPNRIEPPAKAVAPAATTPAAGGAWSAAAAARAQFPEERTLALMAEDLLGRPLDEAMPEVPAPARLPGPPAAGYPTPAGASGLPATGGTGVWDAAMPLVAEG